MASHYSIRDFFRQMPNALLARYFQGKRLFGDLDFASTDSRSSTIQRRPAKAPLVICGCRLARIAPR